MLTLTRSELVSHGACSPALDLFDKLFPSGRMEIELTPLAEVWIAVAFPEYTSWLREKNLIPIANLNSTNLYSADLRSASLRSADLSYADLRSASLRSADLSFADLYSANLSSANLRSANLHSANLRYANLYSANLSSADLSSVNLRYVSLKGAKCGVTDSSLPGKWEVSSFDKEILICVSS
jgi:hypothetical protein